MALYGPTAVIAPCKDAVFVGVLAARRTKQVDRYLIYVADVDGEAVSGICRWTCFGKAHTDAFPHFVKVGDELNAVFKSDLIKDGTTAEALQKRVDRKMREYIAAEKEAARKADADGKETLESLRSAYMAKGWPKGFGDTKIEAEMNEADGRRIAA